VPDIIVKVLAARGGLPPEHRDILGKGTLELSRQEKRIYRREVAPRLDEYRKVLARAFEELSRVDPATADTWATSIAFNIMSRGCASAADTLGMAVIGRRKVSEIVKSFRQTRPPVPARGRCPS